jgi:DNA repair ATPase RecN
MMLYKLVTPLEEINSIKENVKYLKEKTSNLQELKDSKEDNYKKYCEECSKSKEQRKIQIEFLKGQVSNEQSSREG